MHELICIRLTSSIVSYLSARGIHLLEEVKSQRRAAAYALFVVFFFEKKKMFCLSARTLNHISTEYVEGLRSSSYESTGRGSGKLQAEIRFSDLDKFRECSYVPWSYGFRPKACKL